MKPLNYFDHFTLKNSTFDVNVFESYLKSDTVIYSIVDGPYKNVGKAWIKCIKKLNVEFFVVCCDEESYSELKDLCNCLLIKADRYIDDNYYIEYQPHRKYYPEACLETNREMYATFLKYFVSIEILKRNRNVIFSDIDCLWNSDPTEYLNNLDCVFAFQSGGHPKKYKDIFGVAICTGFMYMKSDFIPVLYQCIKDFDGDDQATMNRVIFEDNFEWAERPRSKNNYVALPDPLFRRENVTKENAKDCFVCHPKIERKEDARIAKFFELGLI